MAMKELKTFSVNPGTEEREIQIWRSFGYELVGAPQEIYNQDSHLENDGDDLKNVTTTTHYIKLTFERDPERKNYSELKSLEEQYYGLKEPTLWEKPKLITKLWLILIGVGLLIYVVPGIILLVIHIIKYVKDTKLWNSCYERYRNEMASFKAQQKEIIDKAQALV